MSTRQAGTERAQQTSSGSPDDLFVANVFQASRWAERNQRLLVALGVVVVLLLAGGLYYLRFRDRLADEASRELEAVHQSLALGDEEGARGELATFIETFRGTPYEGEARLLLGELYLRAGSAQQARVVLEPLGSAPREPIEFQGAELLAIAYEQEGNSAEAEATYLRIADRSELDFQVVDALSDAARLRADRMDTAGAIALYERILEEMEEDAPGRGIYEMRIAQLRAGQN